jgi:putative redox protein
MPTHDDTGRAARASEGTVVVTETSAGGYTRQISAGHHQLAADEPPPVGDDTGPTP